MRAIEWVESGGRRRQEFNSDRQVRSAVWFGPFFKASVEVLLEEERNLRGVFRTLSLLVVTGGKGARGWEDGKKGGRAVHRCRLVVFGYVVDLAEGKGRETCMHLRRMHLLVGKRSRKESRTVD